LREDAPMSTLRTPRVAIIGAGQSGIGMAVRLRRAGIETFRIYEMRDGIGGTWHANTYPGLFCDVPSRSYQYRFAPNPDWSRLFSPGEEIQAYIERVAREHDIVRHISFSTEVAEARFADGTWTVRTTAGEEEVFDFVITAAGALVRPRTPDIPGLETFAGPRFHSAEWDHSVEVDGKRVGVVGTGSTGMQLTRALAPVAARFELFQRTPQWVLPLVNTPYSPVGRMLMRRLPALNVRAYRFWQKVGEGTFGIAVIRPGWQRRLISGLCKAHLRRVRDPDLRRGMTRDYRPGCKRLVMGVGFYGLFENPTVSLVDTPIDHVEPRGIVTTDGVLHELDVLVTATGFVTNKYVLPVEFVGPGGRRLTDVWDPQPFAYRTVATPGFPNVFMLIGPHSPFGNQSLFTISETQADFAMGWIERWRRGEFDTVAPTEEATAQFNADLKAAIPDTIWSAGCDSWYIGPDGTPAMWPWTAEHHGEVLREPEPGDWELSRSAPVASVECF
jgi:cation diffusion facilitator CzcD-associated flavoprotein CzcO